MYHTAIATTLTVFFLSSATEMCKDTLEEKCNTREQFANKQKKELPT